jgi:CRISPR-associated exonuclease Cas4
MIITGVQIEYYFHCKRQLWLFAHNIQMERENENVKIGKTISETTFKREKHEIEITDEIERIGVKIDYIDTRNKVVHEIKKSDSFEEAHKWQLLYYIYVLNQRGMEISKGIIDYPKQRKIVEIYMNEETRKSLLNVIENINEICKADEPIKIEDTGVKKNVCKKCSYYELCFA